MEFVKSLACYFGAISRQQILHVNIKKYFNFIHLLNLFICIPQFDFAGVYMSVARIELR